MNNFLTDRVFSETVADVQLTSEFQTIELATEPPVNIQIRKQYGSNCTSKFESYLREVRLAIVLDKECYINKDQHKLTNIKLVEELSPMVKQLVFDKDQTFNCTNQTIRYLDIQDKGRNYGLFIRNNNQYHPDYHYEQLMVTFKVIPTAQDF